MKVKEVMHKGVDWVGPDTPVTELAKIMLKDDIGAIPIGENDQLIGMVTDRDIICKGLAKDNFNAQRATATMSRARVSRAGFRRANIATHARGSLEPGGIERSTGFGRGERPSFEDSPRSKVRSPPQSSTEFTIPFVVSRAKARCLRLPKGQLLGGEPGSRSTKST